MKALIVYDSVYGNTGKVAWTIQESIAATQNSQIQTDLLPVREVTLPHIKDVDLFVVGSPTRGFRPTGSISNLLKSLPQKQLFGVDVAAFDTRICLDTIDSSALRFIVDKGGYAASMIAKAMKKKEGS
jgi:flavodoxin